MAMRVIVATVLSVALAVDNVAPGDEHLMLLQVQAVLKKGDGNDMDNDLIADADPMADSADANLAAEGDSMDEFIDDDSADVNLAAEGDSMEDSMEDDEDEMVDEASNEESSSDVEECKPSCQSKRDKLLKKGKSEAFVFEKVCNQEKCAGCVFCQTEAPAPAPTETPTTMPTATPTEAPTPAPTPNPTPAPTSRQYIRAADRSTAIHSNGGTQAGHWATMHACPQNANFPNCQWTLEASTTRPGMYYIKAPDRSTYLHAHGGTLAGHRLSMHACTKSGNFPNCQWALEKSTTRPGMYYIRASDRSTYAHANGGTQAGHSLTMHACPKNANFPNCQFAMSVR